MIGWLSSRLSQNRLGDLLLLEGRITGEQLGEALRRQRETGETLGQILVALDAVTLGRLRATLAQQFAVRFFAGFLTVFLSCAGCGIKNARAGSQEVAGPPARSELLIQASAVIRPAVRAMPPLSPMTRYPDLFGSTEMRSNDLKAFTKWTGMLERFNREIQTPHGQAFMQGLQDRLAAFRDLPLPVMANEVNGFVNETPYVADINNWGKSDYWSTPEEFFEHGGDCEDFAIAKYAALRSLGVPEDRLRIAIVHDREKDIPHAVLILYTDDGALLLDNQIKSVRRASSVRHYKPIFSINSLSWWLHNVPEQDTTVVAAATRSRAFSD